MTPQEYRDLLAVCDEKFRRYQKEGCETYFNKKDHLWTLYEYETGQFQLPQNAEEGMIYGGCNCGNCHITISSNGRMSWHAAGSWTVKWQMFSRIVWQMSGLARWKLIVILISLRNVVNVS